MSMKRFAALLLYAGFLAGCSSGLVYQRKADPAQDTPKMPVKVAVVAFQNGTEEFTSRGNIFSGQVFNLSRTDINGLSLNIGAAFSVSSLPPGQWAKSLAEDMAASGSFRSVKFMFAPSEVTDEDIVVEGALTKANFTTVKGQPDEFVLHLKALRVSDNTVVREGDVGRSSVRPRNLISGCILGTCAIERIHGYLNGIMQGVFTDARLALVASLEPPPTRKPETPGQDSPEEVINRILGKQ